MSGTPSPRISIITPCLNAARFIEDAIRSVLAQAYQPFEHIVVDGGSVDGTIDILRRHPHLRWVSQPDRGQSDAMNKGFAMATGDIIVYLNADDYFEPDAFDTVVRAFASGAVFVVGKVRLIKEDGQIYVNDPKVGLSQMLRWWQQDAYCYNPAGYFYRREVQEAVGPFNLADHYTMDFEFLIEAARRFPFTRVAEVLGNFRLIPGTKTFENSGNEAESFRRFEPYLDLLAAPDRELYLSERAEHLRLQPPLPAP